MTDIFEESARLHKLAKQRLALLFSGGVTEKAVCVFVEKFWYWTKAKV